MGRFENFTPVIELDEITSAEETMLEELVALSNSSSGQFIRKESGSLVNATLSEVIALSGLSDVAFSGLVNGDILSYNGSSWVNVTTVDQTITLTGDVTGSGTSSFAATIADNKILESMLKAVDAAVDEDILTYEATTGDFEWHSVAEVKSSMSLNLVENTALTTWAGSANITTLGTIGTGTWNATAIGVTKGGTGLATIAVSQILYASATDTIAGLATANSGILVTGATGIPAIATDIPTAVTIGTAYIYRAGGTDIPLIDGGTGQSLSDPNDDQIMMWDDSATAVKFMDIGNGLNIDATPILACDSASLTVDGIVELATIAEINTGTDTTRAIPVDQFVASARNVRYILFRVIEKTTDWSADASTAVGGDLVIPFTGTIVDIEADSDTAGTTGTAIVDVNLNGTTIMTTDKLKWDSTEKSTRDYSGNAPGLTTTAVTAGGIITLDIDTNHTTKSKGLTLFLAIRLT